MIYNNVVREHGKDCVVEYYSAGTVAEPSARVVETDGSISERIPGGGRATMEWHWLRNTMAERCSRGAWFSASVRVTTDGRYTFDFDYDNQPNWHIPPCDETYITDHEKFPRPDDHIPEWHPSNPSRRPG
ncbi:hypothetical protein [Prescottella agglutinans]|uniref:Uncharacterized protein n=1 Tax=Prescottella agglutinans TaxID=1644129 RepID=A0ABT6MK22_9NOCA|nr:hypothetical protein [Prescottella agglutinans]MDH6284672.1 hypothetical protein [Prescottella agglutinans]